MSETPPSPLALSDSTKAPAPASHKVLKRVLIGALILLALLICLAETGLVSLQTNETAWKAESKNETTWVNRRSLHGLRFVPSVTVAVASGSGKTVAERAAASLRQATPSGVSGSPGTKLEITITQVTTEGAHWIPFYKKGSCSFTASYLLEASGGGSSLNVRGHITGTVQQSMKGLCSTSLFRETMGKAVAAAIANEIQRMIAKNG